MIMHPNEEVFAILIAACQNTRFIATAIYLGTFAGILFLPRMLLSRCRDHPLPCGKLKTRENGNFLTPHKTFLEKSKNRTASTSRISYFDSAAATTSRHAGEDRDVPRPITVLLPGLSGI
jgi:hypothetical protein